MGSPVNGTVEVGGPEPFRLDELIRQSLSARHDPREVITDPHARYFGAELGERTLVPGDDASLGKVGFEEWLGRAENRPVTAPPPSPASDGSAAAPPVLR
jgi:hypothetical protein